MNEVKRKSVRFKPDATSVVRIDLSADLNRAFEPKIPALIFSEVAKGCGLVVLAPEGGLKVGQTIRLQLDQFSPDTAVIRWIKSLGADGILQMGLEYTQTEVEK